MSRKSQIGWALGIIAIMILLVWLFSDGDSDVTSRGKAKRKPYVSSNWTVRYQLHDKHPQGLYLFTSLAQAHLDKGHKIVEVYDEDQLDSVLSDKSPKTFMFVGHNFGMSDEEMDSILAHVDRGSEMFMSFYDLTENIYPMFFDEYSFLSEYDQKISVFMNNEKHEMINLFQTDTVAIRWWAFDYVEFSDTSGIQEVRSSFMEMPNYVIGQWGKGRLHIHATPNLFFNYQIKRVPGYKYTEKVLNELPKDRDIVMLEIGRLAEDFGNYHTDDQTGADGKKDDSYLQLIFRDPNLRKAMLLAILAAILFLIFRTKRQRPVVPYKKKKKDMTMAFADTITSIYLSKRNPYGLLQVQKKNFYDSMHRYFFVDLSKREGDKELQVLAEKTNVSLEEIKSFVDAFETKQAFSITDEFIAEMAKRKYAFYKKVGIIREEQLKRLQARELVFQRAMLLPSLMILMGIGIIAYGVYLLTQSMGTGMVLVPAGIVTLVLGSLRLSKPCLIVTKETMIYFNALGWKKVFEREDLLHTEMKKTGVIFNFRENKKLIINYWDMSRFDRKQFERLVSRMHTEEL